MMSDLREFLERVGERVAPRPDAFERLVRARRRRERNRRIAAAALALVVGAAGAGGVVGAFRGAQRMAIGGEGRGTYRGIWPERTWDDAEAAQTRVDAGEDAWRLQPASVGYRFAEEVLGWGRPDEVMVGEVATTGVPGQVLLRIHRFAAPCDLPARTSCPPIVAELEVTVEQLIRRGESGAWSITRIDSPDIDLPVGPGATIRAGERLGVTMRPPASLAEDLVLAAGWHLVAPGCDDWTGVDSAPAREGRVVLTLDAIPPECDAPVPAVLYAWIGERAGDVDPLLTRVEPVALEAVPVVLLRPLEPEVTTAPASAPALPIVATIRCGEAGSGAEVVTPEVQPAEDGVHVTVSNESGPRDVQILDPERSLEWRSSLEAGETRRLVLSNLPPGAYRVYCLPAAPDAYGNLRVVDPDGLWHAPELGCPVGPLRMEFGHAAGSGSADPVDAVEALPGLRGSDVVEYAGYPLASDAFRIVRAGEVIGLVRLARAERGGWVVASVEACPGSGLLATPG